MRKILQAFKAWRKRRRKSPTTYLCDWRKANGCDKAACWYINHGPCKCTRKKKWAKIGAYGEPMTASDLDVMNVEYYEWQIMQQNQKR